MATADEAPIRSYRDLLVALDRRRNQLRLPHLAVDFEANLQDGYTGKIMCGVRNLGPVSFGGLLRALGVELVMKVRSTEENDCEAA
jgi:hypothetical protein